jgi:hypothetical protein
MAARCGFGHRRRVVFAGRRRAVAPVLRQPRRLLSVTGSTLAWAQRAAASSAAAPGVSLLAARLMDELVSGRGAACGRLPVGACPGQAGGRATVGLRVTGSQPLAARKPPRAQGVEHVATSRGWRTRFGSGGRRRWVVLAVLVVAVAVAIVLIVLYAAAVPAVAAISPRLAGRRAPSAYWPKLDSAGGRSRSAVGYQPRSPASLPSPVRTRPREGRARSLALRSRRPANARRRCCWRTRTHDLHSRRRDRGAALRPGLTVTPRRDGADDHHGITPTRRAADCSYGRS